VSRAYVALGSNLGNRLENMKQAVIRLNIMRSTKLAGLSSVYETAPVGGPRQSFFLNACAALDTELSPTLLLKAMLEIEKELGRVRSTHWGPRTIDLDLLIYENIIMNSPLLELPHPRMTERNFVLVPLAELNRDLIIPGIKRTVNELVSMQKPAEGIKLFLAQGWEL